MHTLVLGFEFILATLAVGALVLWVVRRIRRAEDSLIRDAEEFQSIFELSGIAHVKVDCSTRRVIRANRKFCELVGYSAEELKLMTIFDVTHPEDIQPGQNALSTLVSGEVDELFLEKRYIRKDGAIVWGEVTATLIRDDKGAPKYTIGAIQDVTARRNAQEQALRAKELAEAANQSKSVFLANMSHEIRTPLGIILGFADFLLDPLQTKQQRDEAIFAIKRNGTLLARIIDDILDLSKVEADRLEIESVTLSPRDLLEEVAVSLGFRAKQKGVELKRQVDPRVPQQIYTDPTRLRQILINVIGNAIKFTESGSIYADMHMVGDLTLEFEITDTGVGVAPEQVASLFKPFAQADGSLARRFGGTGLGLFISRKLARALGGDLVLKRSSPGFGSTFTLSLKVGPITSLAPIAEPIGPLRERSLSGIRVLLVEDSRDNQILIDRLLTRAGATVNLADDGLSGIEKAEHEPCHVVLMDIQMPGIDGHAAATRLRSDHFTKPIVALTAHAMKEDRERAARSGFDDYLTKPIDPALLIRTIEKWAAISR